MFLTGPGVPILPSGYTQYKGYRMMKRGTEAIFLDVGGTLLELGDPAQAYRTILGRHGYHVTKDQVRSWVREAQEETGPVSSGCGSDLCGADFTISASKEEARREDLIAAILRKASVKEHFDSCRKEILDSWLREPVFRLFPETVSTLKQLKESGFLLGAVSNWEPRLPELCENLGIGRYFDFMLISEAQGYAKPGIRLFELALERAATRPEKVIHVGNDAMEDIQPAESLGIRAVLLQRNGSKGKEHSPRIPSLKEVLPLARASAWIRGRVVSGKGEAAGFTGLPWVREQVASGFNFRPFPGTLNLRLERAQDLAMWKELRSQPGQFLEPEKGYCAAKCFPVSVEGQVSGAIVLPAVPSYPSNVVELLAPVNLREALGLGDGGAVTIALVPPAT